MNTIDQIKAEIERLMCPEHGVVLDNLLDFLDTLQEQPVEEDIITLHLGKTLPDEQYDEVVRSVVAFMNQRWPNCKVGVDN